MSIKYIIESAIKAGKNLTSAQRNSSMFSEAPVVAGKVLRKGVTVVLDEAVYLASKQKIDMLLKAGAIKVKVEGTVAKPEVKISVDEEKLKEDVAPLVESAENVAKELLDVVVEEVASTADPVEPPAEEAPVSRKKRKAV